MVLDEFPALLFQNATRHLNPLIQSTFYRDVEHRPASMVGTDGQPRLTHRVNRQLRLIAPRGPSTTAPERDGGLLPADFYLNRYVIRPRVRS